MTYIKFFGKNLLLGMSLARLLSMIANKERWKGVNIWAQVSDAKSC